MKQLNNHSLFYIVKLSVVGLRHSRTKNQTSLSLLACSLKLKPDYQILLKGGWLKLALHYMGLTEKDNFRFHLY